MHITEIHMYKRRCQRGRSFLFSTVALYFSRPWTFKPVSVTATYSKSINRFTAHLLPHVAIKFRRDSTAPFYALESSKAVSHGILLRRGLEYAADRDASCTSSFGDGQLRTNQKRYQISMNSNSICSTVSIGHLRVSHIRISVDSTR